jgi:2'-hydroxyisoflavone reductase
MPTRREVLQLAAVLGAQASLGLPHVVAAGRRLEMLILGGTGFIGPYQVEQALARGHKVTTFNRGRKTGLYGDQVEELIGDRDSGKDQGLEALKGTRRWDVVIDNSGYVPRHVRDTAELLRGRVGRYLYVSTVAVYDFSQGPVFDEQGPLAPLADPASEEVTRESYGPLKAECDRIVRSVYGGDCTIVRPSYIFGPGDTTDRFTYWADRVARGGDVLGFPDRESELQWVDVRDLCPWIIELAETGRPGVFNAAGPASSITREQTLWGLRALTGEAVRFHWPDRAMLDAMDVSLPLSAAPRSGDQGSSVHFANQASQAAGLRYRPLADTARATLEWWQEQPAERRASARGWPTAEQERAAIERIGGAATEEGGQA